MPDLLTCVKVLTLAVSLGGWIGVALAIRFPGQPLKAANSWITVSATALFVGLMEWLN